MNTAHDEPPAAAQNQKKIFSVELRADGVALVKVDDTEESVNTITAHFSEELIAVLARIESDPKIKSAVLISDKPNCFVVGANIDMLKSIKFASEAERMARELAQGLERIKSLAKPVVAAVHGPALGGGFELALACDAIVASDAEATSFGLPEVKLGLLPGANGLLRVAARAGLQVALDLGLTGSVVRPARAKALGLIDEVCPASALIEVACRAARQPVGAPPPPKKFIPSLFERLDRDEITSEVMTIAFEENPIGRRLLFKKARETLRRKTHGHYPATVRIVDVLECFGNKGFAAAAELEARLFGELVVSETAHRLVEIFSATTALKKDTGVDDPTVEPMVPERVGVLGGGLMGGGVAYVTINAAISVRLKEKDDAGVGRGLRYVRGILEERVSKKEITPLERDAIFARLSGSTDYSGFRRADLVIEAVFEDLALKQAILRDIEAVTRETCIFASSTSSIPIARIAQASKRPETVVGMHYFSPVHKMPLLEVIRTDQTAPWAVAAAVALGKKQGKTPIVVRDGVGFYTSRILTPYTNEACFMVAEGVSIDAVDQALIDWGWPVGPIQLLDEVGIDVAAHVGEIVHAAYGDRMTPPASMAKLLAENRKGRKNERGFYLYGKEAFTEGKRQVDSAVYRAIGVEPRGKLPVEEIQMRCSLQFVNESLLCYGEGLLRSPRDGDIGAVLGLRFPPFRGGPFRYVDTIGAAEVLRRIQGYHDRFGKRWAPAPILVDMAKKGGAFYRD